MKILIVGGSGFIGSALCEYFSKQSKDVSILSRNPNKPKYLPSPVKVITELNSANSSFDVIINLAGLPLNKKRWNDRVKQEIYDSRIQTTAKIIDYIKQADQKPSLLISGSAIGFYGSHEEIIFSEETPPADNGFTHKLCDNWEQTALKAAEYNVRVCLMRTGIVLGENGGALKEMLPPFRLGLGSTLGSGKQWMSWIHMDDVIGAIDFLINHKNLTGAFNFTSPNSVTNAEFSEILAKILHRPCFLSMPELMVKLLFGEMGEILLLKGQNVIPRKLLESGYKFKFPKLQEALTNIL